MIFLIDFDGTVTRRDSVDSLLEAYAEPSWQTLEAQWRAGRIDARRCMTEQLASVRITRAQLTRFLESIEIDPAFAEFHRHARRIGTPVIVSDGLDMIIEYLMETGALPRTHFFANRAQFSNGRLQISFPYSVPACAVQSGLCKCAAMEAYVRRLGGATVVIGDGRSDRCIARHADYVFAKGELAQICEEEHIPHVRFRSFADILPRLSTDLATEPAAHRATS